MRILYSHYFLSTTFTLILIFTALLLPQLRIVVCDRGFYYQDWCGDSHCLQRSHYVFSYSYHCHYTFPSPRALVLDGQRSGFGVRIEGSGDLGFGGFGGLGLKVFS